MRLPDDICGRAYNALQMLSRLAWHLYSVAVYTSIAVKNGVFYGQNRSIASTYPENAGNYRLGKGTRLSESVMYCTVAQDVISIE